MIKLSDFIAKYLKEKHAIKHFFMVSGGGAMHLNDSLGRELSYAACHHEQACAIAAEGYSRLTQTISLVNVTTGPGGINALNGVYGQYTDSVPVLYISGQIKFSTCLASCPELPLRQLGDQEVDIISLVRPISKYAVMLTEANDIKYHLDKAIYEATHGRFGPVWLDIPMNIQSAIIDENSLREFTPPYEGIHSYQIEIHECVTRLLRAKNPLIVAGHGISISKQKGTLKTLIEKLNIPVVTTFNGIDVIETEHKNFMGRIGTIGTRAGNYILQKADCILFLGTRNNIRQVSYNWENFAPHAYKIVVDIDKTELEKSLVKPDYAICADLKDFMPQLIEEINKTNNFHITQEWFKTCFSLKEQFSFHNEKSYKQVGNVINPYPFFHMLSQLLSEEDSIISANGTPSVCLHQVGTIKAGQRLLWNSGNASMGYDLPASIGAYLAHKELGKKGQVICLAGDGSIMMNLQELQTIASYKFPIKIFIINNNGYSSIRQSQRNFFDGRMVGSGDDSGVHMPDFSRVAQAFGFETRKIKNPKTMEEDIVEALKHKGALVVEVMIEQEYAFVPKLSAKTLPDGTMVSPSLEDMFPFVEE